MTKRYSEQQKAVIEWVRNGHGSAFVEAVAGAGKTTTLIGALRETQGSVAFCAYNKKIADEIKAKTADMGLGNRVRVGTFHSFGFGQWRRAYPRVEAGPEAARKKADMTAKELDLSKEMRPFVEKMVGLVKQRAIGLFGSIDDESCWYDIIEHFDLAYEIEDPAMIEEGVKLGRKALLFHNQIAPEIVDFDDMIYQPVVRGMRMFQNDWIFVDEAQDTNPARRALARKMLKLNGRAGFVGDRHQAIYGFTGADADAVDLITKEFNCQLLPLTVTFRCPKAVVAKAREVVSHIQAHETAPEGVVTEQMEDEFFKRDDLTAADAILCRKTAPLIEAAYSFIRRGVPCHVEGRDIGVGLLKLANRWPVRDLDALRDKLVDFEERETEKLIAKGKEVQAENLQDRIATLLTVCDQCQTLDELRTKIASMFLDGNDEQRPTLTLSTVHKSKGREWPRVFLLGKNAYMPSKAARQQWQLDQENSLIYVAYTRAQEELTLVHVKGS